MNYDERLFGWDEWKAPKAIERVVGKDFLYGVTQVSVDQRQRFRDSDFSGEVFSDEDMSCVAQLSGIRKLFIAGTDVGDKGLQRIRHVSSLDELTLIDGYLSDRGLENLPQSLGSPESISLHDVEVSFEGISKLIEERNWSDSAVVVSGVLDLEVASWLGAKEFTVFTASDIDRLPQLTTEPETNSVKELLSSGAYVIVTESDRVSMVMLASKQIGNEELGLLENLPHLEVVSLRKSAVTNDGMKILSQNRHIRAIDPSLTMVTDEGLKFLHEMENLQSIRLSDTRFTRDAIKEFSEKRPHINRIKY